jgi:multisubunit Na+/H+ antiporter MnhB subunit
VIELQLAAIAAIVASSTALFYALDIDGCYPGTRDRPVDLFDFSILGLVGLTALLSAGVNRRRGARPSDQGCTSVSLVAVTAMIVYVQMSHCSRPSKQIEREFIAPVSAVMLGGPMVAIGSVAGWLIGRRSFTKTKSSGGAARR